MTNTFNDKVISEQVDSRLDDLFGGGDEEKSAAPEPRQRSGPGDAGASRAGQRGDERLDAFFDKKSAKSDTATAVSPEMIDASPLKDLKSIVLSLEWEITDQVMQKLGEELSGLEDVYKGDKLAIAFLQLLGSLGKYIRKKRADAHPDSIQLLHTVYEELEKALLLPGLAETEKKRMLVTLVNDYKRLKEEIANPPARPATAPPARKETARAPARPMPDPDDEEDAPQPSVVPDSVLADAEGYPAGASSDMIQTLRDIKEILESELRALRQEIKVLGEHLRK